MGLEREVFTMRARFREIILCCLLALGLSATYGVQHLKAQVLYGSVVGTVTDQSGAVVPKATVTVTNVNPGQAREGTTDDAGYYSIPNVLEGTYDLSVKMTGFRPYLEKGVDVSINAVRRVNPSLQLGPVTESVTVEASAAILQTTKADVNVNLETRAMENLPLSNYRNYQTLINLVPGATPARFQNAEADTPERSLSTNINGQQRGANNTRVDGSADILVTMPHHAVYVPPAALRTGDFSQFLGAQILDASGNPILVPTTEGGSVPLQEGMIFDPFSGILDGTGRAVFSDGGALNVIPTARLNGPMKTLLDLVPQPNLPGDLDNYFVSGTQRL